MNFLFLLSRVSLAANEVPDAAGDFAKEHPWLDGLLGGMGEMPFNAKEMQMNNATYYGLNKLSNNMITFDRVTGLKNPSGFILGCPGAGKSFSGKREMLDTFLRNPNTDILIIDPEREYHQYGI